MFASVKSLSAHLGIHGVGGAHPVDGTLDLAAIGRVAVAGLEVGGAVDDSDAAVGVLLDALALDDTAAHQTDFAADGQAPARTSEAARQRVHRYRCGLG